MVRPCQLSLLKGREGMESFFSAYLRTQASVQTGIVPRILPFNTSLRELAPGFHSSKDKNEGK